ncbi:hypothetical protein L1887_21150 [Cichorium endivia]|nr:hypothetical protein L1887_21150 [Cichorium endivia]
MKRTKAKTAASNDKHLKPSKKLKAGISFDDKTPSDVGKRKESVDQNEKLSRGKRKAVNRDKGAGLNSPMITTARKKALPQGGKSDLMKIATPKIVEKELAKPITCVIGLKCKAKSITQNKTAKIPPKTVEAETQTPQSLVQDPKPVSHEGKEAVGGTTLKRKRGRPFKSQSKRPVAVSHENGNAVHEKEQVKQKSSLVEKPRNTSCVKSVKGKRGKRRKIRSINIVSPTQGGQESSWKQKPNGGLEIPVVVGKSADTISDDQPLSRWFEGIQQHFSATLNMTSKKQIEIVKSPPSSGVVVSNMSFEKRSTLWATLESMELFKLIPQKPHFRPLDNEKECTREGQAISKMVTYLRVVEATSQLKLDNPKSAIEDNLEALEELETHGFDVKVVKDRLTRLLSIKDKQEELEKQSKKLKEKMEVERVEGQRIDKEIELVDKQVVALLERRAQVLLKKEKKDSQVGALEAEVGAINDDMSEAKRKFDGLAAASLSQQTPP